MIFFSKSVSSKASRRPSLVMLPSSSAVSTSRIWSAIAQNDSVSSPSSGHTRFVRLTPPLRCGLLLLLLLLLLLAVMQAAGEDTSM